MKENGVKIENKEVNTSREDNSGPMSVARDLAKALVQIQKGLEDKFLLPPFGKKYTLTHSRLWWHLVEDVILAINIVVVNMHIHKVQSSLS